MKTFTMATATGAGLSAAFLGIAAPALAAGSDAEVTISRLADQGSRVVVENEGGKVLSESSVVSVRLGPDVRQSIPGGTSNGDSARSASGDTVYVTVR